MPLRSRRCLTGSVMCVVRAATDGVVGVTVGIAPGTGCGVAASGWEAPSETGGVAGSAVEEGV